MGCTSSAPNMATSQTQSDKNLKISDGTDENRMEESDEVIYADKENETNVINVLPTCDNLGEQLARNNKSFIDTSSLDLEKDNHGNGHVVEDNDKTNTMKDDIEKSLNMEIDDKLSSLEEVVEKVVELYATDNAAVDMQNPMSNGCHSDVRTNKNNDEIKKSETQTQDMENENIDGTAAEVTASPSQSESSRATRWEALADIAAELPPSHTVDPITGQIYALSK